MANSFVVIINVNGYNCTEFFDNFEQNSTMPNDNL